MSRKGVPSSRARSARRKRPPKHQAVATLRSHQKIVLPPEMCASDRGAYLEALLENLPLATMVLDGARRAIMCNPAFERLFGYRISDILGKTPEKFLMPPSRATEVDGIIRSVTAGEA